MSERDNTHVWSSLSGKRMFYVLHHSFFVLTQKGLSHEFYVYIEIKISLGRD